jgi:hypothetical protein
MSKEQKKGNKAKNKDRDADKNKKPKDNFAAIEKTPQTSGVEYTLSSSKIALSLVPIIGSTASEILSSGVSAVLSKRRSDWEASVVEGFKELYETKEELIQAAQETEAKLEEIVSTLQATTKIAMQTESKVKHEALKNAFLNTVLPSSPDSAKRNIFLRYVEELSEWHIRILGILNIDSKLPFMMHSSLGPYGLTGFDRLMDVALPGHGLDRGVYKQIAIDLIQRGLIYDDLPIKVYKPSDPPFKPEVYARQSHLTPLGQDFLAFIVSPIPNQTNTKL